MSNSIEKAKLIIAKNFRDRVSLDYLSKEVGLSKFHFLRVFKNEIGTTPHEYINTVRLEHACHMLNLYPQVNLTDIAFEAGFSSPSVFSRSFRNKFDTSPIAYKKKLHKNKSNPTISKSANLPICYMERKTIRVESSNLIIDNLNNGFKGVVSSDGYAGKIHGIFMDAPMHKELEDSRYYFGVECASNNTQLSYDLDSGYYTFLDVKGDFHKVIKMIVDFKETMIDTSPYEIDSLIAYEIINFKSDSDKFNYFSVNRRLFIKIKRR